MRKTLSPLSNGLTRIARDSSYLHLVLKYAAVPATGCRLSAPAVSLQRRGDLGRRFARPTCNICPSITQSCLAVLDEVCVVTPRISISSSTGMPEVAVEVNEKDRKSVV